MFLEFLIKPVTSARKFFNNISQNILIVLSICIPLLTAIIPAFIIQQTVGALLKPLTSLFGEQSSKLDLEVFKAAFERIFILTIIVIILVIIILAIYNNFRKEKLFYKYLWRAMVISSFQIIYYFIIGAILSFLDYKLFVVSLIGIINSVICLYSLVIENDIRAGEVLNIDANSQVDTEQINSSDVELNKHANNTGNNLEINKTNMKESAEAIINRIKNLNKKQKTTVVSVISVIVVITIFVITGNALTSKNYVSKKLSAAIKANNAKDVIKYISSSDSRLKVDENNINAYLDYLKENPSYASKILNSIEAQGNEKKSAGTKSVFSSMSDSSDYIKLISKGKKLIIFDNYTYQLPAYFIKIGTDYKNTEVSLNGKSLYVSDQDKFTKECGPFLPGKYKLQGTLKTEYIETKGDKEITLSPENTMSNKMDVHVELSGKKLSIYSEYKDAKVMINGKDTGVTIGTIDKLVPLPDDGSCKISLQNQFPWGTMKSNEVVFDKNVTTPKFDKDNKELLEQVKPTITSFIKSYVDTYTSFDTSKLVNATSNYVKNLDSSLVFEKNYSKKTYTGTINKMVVGLESLSLNSDYSNKNDYRLNIECEITGDFTSGSKPVFDKKVSSIRLIYSTSEKKWLVDGFGETWFSSGIKNPVEVKMN